MLTVKEVKTTHSVLDRIGQKFVAENKGPLSEFYLKKFEKIPIYGSLSQPLFRVSDLEVLFEKTNIRSLLSREDQNEPHLKRYREGEHFIYGIAEVDSATKIGKICCKKVNSCFFTEKGLIAYMSRSRGITSEMFRSYVLIMVRELFHGDLQAPSSTPSQLD